MNHALLTVETFISLCTSQTEVLSLFLTCRPFCNPCRLFVVCTRSTKLVQTSLPHFCNVHGFVPLQQCNHVNSYCYCKKCLVRCWFIEICLLPLFSPLINSSATEEKVMSVEVVWLPPLERSGQSNVDTRNDWIIQPSSADIERLFTS